MEALKLEQQRLRQEGWICGKIGQRWKIVLQPLTLEGLHQRPGSLVITMDDAFHPYLKIITIWVIWNLPVQAEIQADTAREDRGQPDGAVQGNGPTAGMPTKGRNRRLKPFIPIPLPPMCWIRDQPAARKPPGRAARGDGRVRARERSVGKIPEPAQGSRRSLKGDLLVAQKFRF